MGEYKKEIIQLHFSNEIYIEITPSKGKVMYHERSTGYGSDNTMETALSRVKDKLGHTTVQKISTIKYCEYPKSNKE